MIQKKIKNGFKKIIKKKTYKKGFKNIKKHKQNDSKKKYKTP